MTGELEIATPGRRSRRRRRRAWLAALLSLLAPGAGQLYNGEPGPAAIFFSIFLVLNLAVFFVLPILHPDLPAIGAFAGLSVGGLVFQIAAASHAFIHARRAVPAPLATYQRGWIYAAVAVAAPALNFAGAPPWVGSYYAPSASNVPTILVGDRFLVELGYYRDHAVKRGEMVVFVSPVDGRTVFVKRAVGLPGEKIQLRGGELYINGEEAPRQRIEDYPYRFGDTTIAMHQFIEKLSGDASYRILKVPSGRQFDDTPVYDIPAGHYFMLGDNRDNSVDSRMPSQIGYVPAANLVGRAYIVYWPLARLGDKLN